LSDRSYLRAADRLLLTAIVNIVLMLAYAMSLGPARRWRRPLQVLWCRALCSIAGLRVRQSGRVRTEGPTLFVANHVSYLDIPVIARYVDATFVAKAEVAGWPLFGHAAKLTRTIFIQRVGAEAPAQGRQMLDRLASGENLMLFAEGTSTDGSAVAPFKSSLFGIAEDPPPGIHLAIQPVSISYTRALDGKPLVGRWRELYCWFGEATMLPHLWRMVSLPGAEVELRFCEPIPAEMNRKGLARRAQAAVAAGVAAANAPLIAETAPAAVQPEDAVSSAPDEAAVETSRSAPAFH
jgi:lyso-ornithine lipid O-acyltransferase